MPLAPMTRPSEDDLIVRYFRPLATDPGAFRLGDDCAVLRSPEGHELVLKTDAVAEGVHFFAEDNWGAVAKKALRVNLSDLAAKGAQPIGYLLSLALPSEWTEQQLADFAAGLAEDQATFGLSLLGGDTIRSPKGLVITITIFGAIPVGRMVRRGGTKPGDRLYVSGTIGDAALGLKLRLDAGLADRLHLSETDRTYLLDRYLLPRPRSALASAVLACASGGMDVSDGLVLDLTRMARVSGINADIVIDHVPLSDAARAAISADPALLSTALTGGDDYELLVAIPSDGVQAFEAAAQAAGIAVTDIGRVCEGTGRVRLINTSGHATDLAAAGYSHF